MPDTATQELRELVRLRDRLMQDLGDRVRQLHRAVDLGLPEFTRYARTLDSEVATAGLHEYPTAEAYLGLPWKRLAKLCYAGRHKVGEEIAKGLVDAAKVSVGRHHGPAYRVQVPSPVRTSTCCAGGCASLTATSTGRSQTTRSAPS